MATVAAERFTGFPREALAFLGELKAHNEKPWFEANRKTFEEALRAGGRYEIAGQTYKNVPAAYARRHPRAELLKHTGLHAQRTEAPVTALHSAALVEHALEQYRALAPLVRWLGAHI